MAINPDDLTKLLKGVLEPHHVAELLAKRIPPPKQCENCGKTMPVGDSAINVIPTVQFATPTFTIGSVGHPALPPIQCGNDEHWACCPDCWRAVAHNCIDKDLYPLLVELYKKVTGG